MKKNTLYKAIIITMFLIIISLLIFKEEKVFNFKIILDIVTVVASIATAATVILLTWQIRQQRNKDNTELIFNLYRDFYNNPVYSELFSIIDCEYDKMLNQEFPLNQVIDTIITSEPFNLENKSERDKIEKRYDIKLPREIDLCNYLNFFNSLGQLIEENEEIRRITDNIFNYQIKRTFAHPILINYLYKNGFQGMLAFKHQISIPFFFYGTLKNSEERQENIGNWKWKPNIECKLYGYTLVEILDNGCNYSALIESKNSFVAGVYTEVEITDFFEFFTTIDKYEEVDILYERRLDWINLNDSSEKKLCWIYIKKQYV